MGNRQPTQGVIGVPPVTPGGIVLPNPDVTIATMQQQIATLQTALDTVSTTLEFSQSTPASVWEITHTRLNWFPAVAVVDSAGSVVLGDIEYLPNKVILSFQSPFSGKAYLN